MHVLKRMYVHTLTLMLPSRDTGHVGKGGGGGRIVDTLHFHFLNTMCRYQYGRLMRINRVLSN